ncbi:hypothetical protein [Marinobacter sp. OP 3.4]|uniref:hypothetical protein n=1 Tax=Marinobacter sp. OP 3.4 TaxID=3076501 RepID=UPI002E1CB515
MSKLKYDWERIEKEWRANKLSNREISARYGASEAAIRQRAKKYNWVRDLESEVDKRTKDKIRRGLLKDQHEPVTDEEIVEQVASRTADVVHSHRKDIQSARGLAGMLMGELLDNTANFQTLQELVEQQADEEEWDAQRRARVNRALSLPQRAVTIKDLSVAMKNFQTLERTAFGINSKEGESGDTSLEDALLKGIQRAQARSE